MIKKLLIVFIGLIAITCYAQENTASPYSFYGIGSLKFKGTVENRSMGGLSIYTDSIHVNLRNPASLTGANLGIFGGESRPVKYTVGGGYSSINLKSDTSSGNVSSTTFDYLALNLPIGRFGIGLGILPYTSVGYRLQTVNDDGFTTNRFNGEGGLNKVLFGLGYLISKNLSIGVDANYNFGNIQNNAIAFRFDDDGTPLVVQSQENNRSDLSGLNFNFGLTYKGKLKNGLQLTSGVTYTPESNITSQNQRSFSTVAVASSGNISTINTVDVDLESLGLEETELVLPAKFSFGLGLGKERKWFLGAEYEAQQISNFDNPIYDTSATNYEDASRFSVGGFYIPQYNAFSGFFKRVVYRAGVRMENTGLNIQNESIKEFGISFGVGIPTGEYGSNANIGFELGRRGTTNNNLIRENFINFQISLSLNDRWFQKRKFN